MSELIHNNNPRAEELLDFAVRLINGENARQLIIEHQLVIRDVTPEETMQVLDKLLVSGFPLESVKVNVGKILNVFYRSLNAFKWNKPAEGHFLHYLMLENRAAELLLEEIKAINKVIFKPGKDKDPELIERLGSLMSKLAEYELH